jgi:hypothetical protein
MDDFLWKNISLLPLEIREKIGSYSTLVMREKINIRREFFNKWIMENVDRILDIVLHNWTKHQAIWLFIMCKGPWQLVIGLSFYPKRAIVTNFLRTTLTKLDNIDSSRLCWQRLKAIEILVERRRYLP